LNFELGTSCKLAPAEGASRTGRFWGQVRLVVVGRDI